MAKIKNKLVAIKDWIDEQITDIELDWMNFQNKHPFIGGHIYGCVVIYWSLIAVNAVMRLFRKKELGWVDIKR